MFETHLNHRKVLNAVAIQEPREEGDGIVLAFLRELS